MKKNNWTYLMLIVVGALAAWIVAEYVKVQPLQATVNKQAKELAKFDECKQKLDKFEKIASARNEARRAAKDNDIWSIASVDFFADGDSKVDGTSQPTMKLVVNAPESLNDVKGALVHLSRKDKEGYSRTKSIPLGKEGVKTWGKLILNAENARAAKFKLQYIDSTTYYSFRESDTEGDYLLPVVVK